MEDLSGLLEIVISHVVFGDVDPGFAVEDFAVKDQILITFGVEADAVNRFFTLKQKTLDRKTAQLLLETGRAPLKGCVSSKTGKVYDAAVVLEDDGNRARFKLVFGNG